MNPTEKTTDIHIRFNKQMDSSDNTLNSKFQTRFIQTPCQGCGSSEHPLLKLKTDVINSDEVEYTYECPVVESFPLYTVGSKDIKITYLLSARTFAEYYKYDLEVAFHKEILRANRTRDTRPEYYDTFMNDVRRICLQHHERSPTLSSSTTITPSVQTSNTRILRKRKPIEDSRNILEEPNYSTPPRKSLRLMHGK